MAFDTAANIINDAAVEIGLGSVTDPFTSQDANFAQLCRLLKSCGRELVMARNWTYLRKEFTFTTVANKSVYSMPTDFLRMYDQTGWNRTNRLPLGGPLSPQEWQYLKARLVGVVFTVLFRPMNRTIAVYPDTNTPAGYQIAFEYGSNYWVQSTTASNPYTAWSGVTVYALGDTVRHAATGCGFWTVLYSVTAVGASSPATAVPSPAIGQSYTDSAGNIWSYNEGTTLAAPSASADIIWFDPLLMVRSLKLAFLKAKGLDTTAAEQDYASTLQSVMGMDAPGKVLNLNRTSMDPSSVLVGGQSVPITGFGS